MKNVPTMDNVKHYHVLSGNSGCMPDYNSGLIANRRQAVIHANGWRKDCLSDCEGLTLDGSDGNYSGNGIAGIDYIEVVTCYEHECIKDMDASDTVSNNARLLRAYNMITA